MDDIVIQRQSFKTKTLPTLLEAQKIQRQTQSLKDCLNMQNNEQTEEEMVKVYIEQNPNRRQIQQNNETGNLHKSIQQTGKNKSFNITDIGGLTVIVPKEQIIMLQAPQRRQLQTKQDKKIKNKEFPKPEHRTTTHKKHHHQGQSELSSNLEYSSQRQSMDSFEEFKQYKKKKKSNSIKFLIKKVENLQKQVKQLKSENNHLQKNKQQKKAPEIYPINKAKGLTSNLISIKVESQNVSVKEDILIELKKLREKVDHLESKSIDVSRIKQNSLDQFNFSPRNTIEQKHQNLSNLINEHKTVKQTGKIFKKSEIKQIEGDTQKVKEQKIERPQVDDHRETDLQQNIKQDTKNEQKRRDAITIMRQIQKQKNEVFQQQKNQPNNEKQSKSQIFTNIVTIENAKKQSSEPQDSELNVRQFPQTNRDHNKYQINPTSDDHGFKRSGKPIPNINVTENVSRSDWQQSLKMLQFDTGKQKLIIDINNTSDEKKVSRLSKNVSNQIYSYQDAEELIPPIPKVTIFPNYDTSEQQLIEIGKQLFSLLKVEKINDETTVLNVRKYKNCTYFGIDAENNILMYYQGKVYFGGWKQFMNSQGQKCGNGLQFQHNKFIYKGQFNNGNRNGFGVLKVTNNSQSNIYIGQFIDGVKHGEGRQINENNVLYDGEWKDGKKDGFGKLILSKTQIYEGTFEQGLKSGHGMEHFKNGDRYQGEYLTGKFHGKGRYYWSNDSVYEGQFKNGMRNGYGIWRSQNNLGDVYEGTYENDMKNGQGIYHWANGTTYNGNFVNDKKHGKGTITDQNGKAFNYQWQNDNILRKGINESDSHILSNSNIRNFNKILPVNRKFSSSRDRVEKNVNNQVVNTNPINKIRISRSTSNMQRTPSRNRHTHHQEQLTEGHKVENVIKPHLVTERPLTSKSVSNQSNSTFKLQRKSAGPKSAFPKDPPYQKMRSTANIINF